MPPHSPLKIIMPPLPFPHNHDKIVVEYTKTTDVSLEGTTNNTTCNCVSYTDEEIQEAVANVLGGAN